MTYHKILETDRLLLRPTNEEDAEFILALLNSPTWINNIGDRHIRTIAEAKAYILHKYTPQLKRLGYSNYTLIRKADNFKIGVCGLIDRDGLDGIDIGYALLPEYEKMGFAFEAAERVKEAAFNEFRIENLKAITLKDNISSQNLLLKLGFELVGVTKLPNDDDELLLYLIENKNFDPLQSF